MFRRVLVCLALGAMTRSTTCNKDFFTGSQISCIIQHGNTVFIDVIGSFFQVFLFGDSGFCFFGASMTLVGSSCRKPSA